MSIILLIIYLVILGQLIYVDYSGDWNTFNGLLWILGTAPLITIIVLAH